jgi:hypothetical protein
MGSGQEYERNGVYRLYSELKGHKDGKMSCPSDHVHSVVVENTSVCDINVEFKVIPQTELVSYAGGTPWIDSLCLGGSSKPRRKREDWSEEEMLVGPRPALTKARLKRDVDVTSDFRWRSEDGFGPAEPGVSLQHRLILT